MLLAAETFENERPVIYTMEEIERATSNFDETRKIGEGGYGSVYFGVLGELVHKLPCYPLIVCQYMNQEGLYFV